MNILDASLYELRSAVSRLISTLDNSPGSVSDEDKREIMRLVGYCISELRKIVYFVGKGTK